MLHVFHFPVLLLLWSAPVSSSFGNEQKYPGLLAYNHFDLCLERACK